MSGRPLAVLRGVSQRFGEREAVADLSLEVRAGEVFGLLGPNGAGKTTSLRILTGLLAPSSGAVEIDGIDLTRQPLEARKRFGYVPDGAPLYSNLTPLEHLALVGRLHGLSEAALGAEAARLLDALELSDRRDDPVGNFSRGMRQKVAIACALLPRPPLLVLDEPLTGLDTGTTLVIKALMRAWAERGGAVFLTSHQLEVVERVCDRMAILSQGRLVAQGDLDSLRRASGQGGTLDEVFRALTHAEDPALQAAKILGN
ncbi:MAG: ABC transporter ATP-binding protein [Planctomycetota bacterium]